MKIRDPAAEAGLLFLAVMAALWLAPENARVPFVLVLCIGVALSWRLRGDSLRDLGIIPGNWKPLVLPLIVSVLIVIGIKLIAIALAAPGAAMSGERYVGRLLNYLPWALFQQLILGGYFAHRFHQQWKSRLRASCVAGLCFALVHAPNPMLMIVVAVCGPLSAYLFLKYRNPYLLAVMHAAIGAGLFFLSGADFYSMRVGP